MSLRAAIEGGINRRIEGVLGQIADQFDRMQRHFDEVIERIEALEQARKPPHVQQVCGVSINLPNTIDEATRRDIMAAIRSAPTPVYNAVGEVSRVEFERSIQLTGSVAPESPLPIARTDAYAVGPADGGTKPDAPAPVCPCCDRPAGHSECWCVKCADCKGTGYYVGFTEHTHCPTCDGSGWLTADAR